VSGEHPEAATPGEHRRPLRVLAVIPSLLPDGGAEQSIVAVAPLLAERGIDFQIVVLHGEVHLGAQLMEHGIQVTALDSGPSMSRYRNRVVAMRRLIRSTKPDLVHATLHPAIVASAPAVLGTPARLVVTWANTPLEATEHAGLVPWRVWLRHTIEMVLTTAVRARFHAVTNGVAQACRRRYRVSARRVRVAERGRDAQRFAPLSAAELDSLRASLGIDPTQRVVLAVGRVAPQKNHVALVTAFDSVAHRYPDAVLLIAGARGSSWAEVEQAVGSAQHHDRIRLLGQRDDVPALLQIASVIVCSSKREGAAGALIEAMATSTPIVSTRLDGLEGVLEHGRNAWVSDDLAGGIAAVLDDPTAAAVRAQHARRDFEERFTVERAADALAEVYRWAAQRGGVSAPGVSAAEIDREAGPIEVAQVMWRLSRGGGVQTVVRMLINESDPASVRFTIVPARPMLAEDGLEELPVSVMPGRHLHGSLRLHHRLQIMFDVARRLRSAHSTVVHLHSGTIWMGFFIPLVARRRRYVVEVHDAPGSGRHGRVTDRVEGWWSRLVRAQVVCHSSSVALAIAERWGVPPARLTTVPLAVDPDQFDPMRYGPDRARRRAELGLPADAIVLVVVGRLVPSKRFVLVVESLAQLDERVHLVVVGEGSERGALERRAAELGVADRVHFVGFLGELGPTVAAADMLVSASEYEGFGLTVAEGMMLGLPVVATAAGGVTDVVVDGETGVLVPVNDGERLTSELAALVADEPRRTALGKAGRSRAVEQFSPTALVRAFGELYRRQNS